MEAKMRDELIAQRTSHEASRLTFKMVVTLKMLARRVRTRSQYRAPLTMSQQRIVADYEEQVYQVSFSGKMLFVVILMTGILGVGRYNDTCACLF